MLLTSCDVTFTMTSTDGLNMKTTTTTSSCDVISGGGAAAAAAVTSQATTPSVGIRPTGRPSAPYGEGRARMVTDITTTRCTSDRLPRGPCAATRRS
jgi:hypothetical protein